jgi:hypothetical protein
MHCPEFFSFVVDEDRVWVSSDEASFCSQQPVVCDDASEAKVFDKFSFFEGGDRFWLREGSCADWCFW